MKRDSKIIKDLNSISAHDIEELRASLETAGYKNVQIDSLSKAFFRDEKFLDIFFRFLGDSKFGSRSKVNLLRAIGSVGNKSNCLSLMMLLESQVLDTESAIQCGFAISFLSDAGDFDLILRLIMNENMGRSRIPLVGKFCRADPAKAIPILIRLSKTEYMQPEICKSLGKHLDEPAVIDFFRGYEKNITHETAKKVAEKILSKL